MRSIGMVLIIMGVAVLYLGLTSKAPRAWYALRTGLYMSKSGSKNAIDSDGEIIDGSINGGGQ
jgi:hypothetical protein